MALAGEELIRLLTTDPGVRARAIELLPFAAVVPVLGMPAWLLDGVFIGATQGRALRNAAILATLLYIATDLLLRPLGALGLWLAFVASYLYRAGALGWRYPALLRSLDGEPQPSQSLQ
jgi:MATE family multidrug resistance protein